MTAVLDLRASRHDRRLPFFTPIVAASLSRCWATNISAGGIGLTAFVTSAVPERGDDLELEFVLGESKTAIVAVGRVAWTSLVRPDGRIGLGVEFRELSQEARSALALFRADHRPRVIVALAPPTEQELIGQVLEDLHVELVDDERELGEELLRSCASLVVCTEDADRLTRFLEVVWEHARDPGIVPGELPLAPIILCTAIESDRLLRLVTDGKIYEVIRPPFDRRTLGSTVARSCERWALQQELRWASLQLEARSRPPRSTPATHELPVQASNIIRASPAMQRAYQLIGTVAGHDVPVLLTGETGAGKELAAREIHMLSKRAHTPFVAQDCGALIETLLESELFGHVRGAFTGATTDHPGLFQLADGGTIFLDEIQNTSPALQAKLLRVVEVGEVRPVGGSKPRRVNVRIIAACNVDLRQAVKEQRFRADFFYRLNRFPIELPPLREHVEDILPLTRFFVASISKELGRPLNRIDPRVERALLAYDWPGNIRELKNAIERALLLTPPDEPLRWDMLPEEIRGRGDQPRASTRGLDSQLEEFERRVIEAALARNDRVIRRAARELEVNAVTLARRMRRLGLS